MSKKIKKLLAFLLGFICSGIAVYAAGTYVGSGADLTYDNSSSWLHFTNVQAALDELYQQKWCPIGYSCLDKKSTLAVGDYISYTPTKTTYTTNTSMTGSTSTQTINPSELNVWRVLSVNGNGTVDIISEYVSSVGVKFGGQVGYQNFVGYLNVLASQYENPTYTSGSRYFGFNGQTEYITDTSKFVNPAPWTCDTGESCNPVESQGGGDTLYTTDYDLVNTVLGTALACKVGTSSREAYWVGSRLYEYSSETSYYWRGRYMSSGSAYSYGLYRYSSSGFGDLESYSRALRPIVTLKSGLSYAGFGTKEYPMEIVG